MYPGSENKPLFSISVNKRGEETLNTVIEIKNAFESDVDLFINEGDLRNSHPSTIVDITQSPFKIIRHGVCPIDRSMLK